MLNPGHGVFPNLGNGVDGDQFAYLVKITRRQGV